MSAPDAGINGKSEPFGFGDVVWFDYPHLDTARPCPKGLSCYEQLHHQTLPDDKTFVLVMEAKRRTVLILAYIGPKHPERACYWLMKLRTADANEKAKDNELLLYKTKDKDLCYACIDLVNRFPESLARQKDRLLGTSLIKQITARARASMWYGPAVQHAPGEGNMA